MNDINLGKDTSELLSYIRSEKNKYLNLFNTRPTTDAGTHILDYYRGALSVLVNLENKLK